MSTLLAQFHLLHPWWLLALLPLPLALWWLARRLRGDAALARLADAALLPLLMAPGRRGRRLPLALLAASWVIAAVAFAGPAWERLPQPLSEAGGARVIALSLADTMLARDIKPDRLTRARYKIRDLLQTSGDTRNALIAYAGDAFVVAPLTSDANTVASLLGALDPSVMPVSGDDTAAAIDLGVKLLAQAGVRGGDIVLVTSSAGDEALAAARAAQAAGVHVSVLAVGSVAGAPVATPGGGLRKNAAGDVVIAHLEASQLQALAAAGGGRYQPLRTDNADIKALRAHHVSRADASARHQTMAPRWRDRGPWLLLALLPLVALMFRRGWLLALPLALIALPAPARAGGLPDLWHNADQQAAIALAKGQAKRAATLARDPAWRGSAQFRAGNYAAAVESFAAEKGAQARYNQGNALAALGKYQEAIGAYDRALKLDPTLADAAANRKAIKDWLQRQKQQRKQDTSGKQGDSTSQNKQSQQGKSQQGKSQQGKSQQGKSQQGKSQQGKQPQQGKSQNGNSQNGKAQGKQRQGEQADKAQDQNGKSAGAQSKQNKQSKQGNPKPASAASAGNKPQPASEQPSPQDKDQPQPAPATSTSAAQRQVQKQQAQQAMKQRMDQALKQPPGEPVHVLGTQPKGDKHSKLPADLRQALERVPDDPGGLLRRKFMLQYQRRHAGAAQ